jgi:sterol desaturase/sphingolipid hydroxylase (fatty acid hydroxylase superfamily)
MQSALDFFEGLGTLERLGWVLACLAAGQGLGALWPAASHTPEPGRPQIHRHWRGHWRVNLTLLGTTLAIHSLFGAATVGLFAWVAREEWGLWYWVGGSVGVRWLMGLALLDLIGQYLAHALLHHIPALWRLHRVHHSDLHVDATTGTRHHPLDFAFRETFALLAILLTGAPMGVYVSYRILTVLFTYWTHADLRLPARLENVLGWVLVTPAMHKFHHHEQAPWTDKNLGNMLSIWDRLLGTYVKGDPGAIRYGLDIADPEKSHHVGYQLRLPFLPPHRPRASEPPAPNPLRGPEAL